MAGGMSAEAALDLVGEHHGIHHAPDHQARRNRKPKRTNCTTKARADCRDKSGDDNHLDIGATALAKCAGLRHVGDAGSLGCLRLDGKV